MFPADPNVFECAIEGCEGLRYIGSRAFQMKARRQPRYFFVMADVKKQLKNLLERKDVWSGVKKTKDIVKASIASPHVIKCISDIVDG